MATITFDTHKFIRKLKESGFDERQAEGISEALQEAEVGHDLATRRDVDSMRQEIREWELRMDAKLEAIRGDIKPLRWMLGVIAAGVVALVIRAFFPV